MFFLEDPSMSIPIPDAVSTCGQTALRCATELGSWQMIAVTQHHSSTCHVFPHPSSDRPVSEQPGDKRAVLGCRYSCSNWNLSYRQLANGRFALSQRGQNSHLPFCRFFGLGWGLRSLHNENTVTPPQRLRLWGTIYLPSWARSGLCTPGPWGKDLGAWLRAEIHFHRGQNQAPDIYMSTLALEILSLLWRSLKPPLLLGAPGTPIHIANKIRFLFTHPEFINQKRRYSHTLDELPLADITRIIVIIQFWWYSWRLNNPSLI